MKSLEMSITLCSPVHSKHLFKLNYDLTIRSFFLTKYALLFFLLRFKNYRKKENI